MSRAQVISTELNRAVVELLQQLLFWQERAKASSPYNVTKRKRLVSGLRCLPPPLPCLTPLGLSARARTCLAWQDLSVWGMGVLLLYAYPDSQEGGASRSS